MDVLRAATRGEKERGSLVPIPREPALEPDYDLKYRHFSLLATCTILSCHNPLVRTRMAVIQRLCSSRRAFYDESA